MPEIAGSCVKKLAAGAPMAGKYGPFAKKYMDIYMMSVFSGFRGKP